MTLNFGNIDMKQIVLIFFLLLNPAIQAKEQWRIDFDNSIKEIKENQAKERQKIAPFIAECEKAKRTYNFYNKKMNRTLFSGIFTSTLTGRGLFDSNKHDNYEIQRDNAESFLEINNCYKYNIGIY